MHPSSFEYYAPNKMEDVLSLLSKYGEDARILAGGQSLIPLLKLRLASYPYIIDISGIREMNHVEEDKLLLRIGALTTINDIADNDIIKNKYQILHEAALQIADPLVRNRGTIGGNISHGDPSNDIPAVMIALKAKLVIIGENGTRNVSSDKFILDTFTTALQVGEILKEIHIPAIKSGSGGCYVKYKKNAGDFSIAAIAVFLNLDEDEVVAEAGIGLTSVAPKPVRAVKAEDYLKGKRIDRATVREACEIIVNESDPVPDFYGGADFKKKVLRKIGEEAIQLAFERALVR